MCERWSYGMILAVLNIVFQILSCIEMLLLKTNDQGLFIFATAVCGYLVFCEIIKYITMILVMFETDKEQLINRKCFKITSIIFYSLPGFFLLCANPLITDDFPFADSYMILLELIGDIAILVLLTFQSLTVNILTIVNITCLILTPLHFFFILTEIYAMNWRRIIKNRTSSTTFATVGSQSPPAYK